MEVERLSTSKIVQSGRGILWGISNNKAQLGKALTMYDGDAVLCVAKLDVAFPGDVWRPGMLLNVLFATNLRAETDGEEIDVYWF